MQNEIYWEKKLIGKKMKKKNLNKKLEKNMELTTKEKAKLSAPRNEMVRLSIEEGLFSNGGFHKDKKKAMKQGKVKHKKKFI